jgi:5-deoxy-glucuronate isomerase
MPVQLNREPKVFRDTASHEGWKEFFNPRTGEMQYLSYARCVFTDKVKSHRMQTGDREWALFCVRGPVSVTADGRRFELQQYDMAYVPRDSEVVVEAGAGGDIVFGGALAVAKAEAAVVRYNEIKDDPAFFFDVGDPAMGTKRRIHNMLGHNVNASRLLAGFTIGEKTAWTSWPPHEHSTSKEEFYLFLDMPAPAFSTQFVYSDPKAPEFTAVVRENDCVTIPGGYHPTAAAPGYRSVFLWVMAAFDPKKDRDFKHGISIQPEYQDIKFV